MANTAHRRDVYNVNIDSSELSTQKVVGTAKCRLSKSTLCTNCRLLLNVVNGSNLEFCKLGWDEIRIIANTNRGVVLIYVRKHDLCSSCLIQ